MNASTPLPAHSSTPLLKMMSVPKHLGAYSVECYNASGGPNSYPACPVYRRRVLGGGGCRCWLCLGPHDHRGRGMPPPACARPTLMPSPLPILERQQLRCSRRRDGPARDVLPGLAGRRCRRGRAGRHVQVRARGGEVVVGVMCRRGWERVRSPSGMRHRTYLSTRLPCSYNAINGVPACANGDVLRTALEQDWGLQGFVISE